MTSLKNTLDSREYLYDKETLGAYDLESIFKTQQNKLNSDKNTPKVASKTTPIYNQSCRKNSIDCTTVMKTECNEIDYTHVNSQRLSEKLSEALVERYMPFIKSIASNVIKTMTVPGEIEFEDLISYGVEGLLKAQVAFKKKNKSQFQTYAYYRIKGHMIDAVRNEWHARLPEGSGSFYHEFDEEYLELSHRSAKTDTEKKERTSFSYTNVPCWAGGPNKLFARSKTAENLERTQIDENNKDIWKEIDNLDEKENNIMRLLYIHGYKQLEIAEYLNLSKSKVCRIHMDVLKKLRERLAVS